MPELRTLSGWLTAPLDPLRIVACRGEQALGEPAFRAEVGAWWARLRCWHGRDIALYFDDTVDCAAALLAAWQHGCRVWLPGDTHAATAAALHDRVAACIGDFPQPAALDDAPTDTSPRWHPLDPNATELVVFTSGSTGEPTAIAKHLHQLQAELDTLEHCFGSGLGDAVVHATVSHQHIYGLLFRLLWPLVAGRCISAERLAYPEQIALLLATAPSLLVATPAHLSRLPDTLDWAPARAQLRALFSSGGPLPGSAAVQCARLLRPATEVYGSSETGGVAWRRRDADQDTPWQPLPGVELALDDGLLQVRSPHLPDGAWHRSCDRAELDGEGRLHLLGRADRIVKIEERRVSLQALERALRDHPQVQDARVIVLPGARRQLAAAIVPSSAGNAALAGARKALVDALRTRLLDVTDRVCLPRRWRFVDAWPIDARGKTTDAALRELFRPHVPQPIWQQPTPGRAIATFTLSAELAVFDGHFPQAAVLPGVALLDWAIRWSRERFGITAAPVRIEQLKFQRLARPGMHLELELSHDAERGTVQFQARSEQGPHAGGRIVLRDAP